MRVDKIFEWIEKFRRRKPPSGVDDFTAEIEMANVRLRWVNSAPKQNQRALSRTVIEARVSPTFPWAVINEVLVPGNELLLQDIAAGDWEFQATEVDVADIRSPVQKNASVSIPFEPPSGVTEFSATVE